MKLYAQILNDKVHWIFPHGKSVGELINGIYTFPTDMIVVEAEEDWKEGWDYPPKTIKERVSTLEIDVSETKYRVDKLEKIK